MKSLSLSLFLLVGLFSMASLAVPATNFKKVVIVIFENENYSTVISQADFAAFAAKGVSLTNMLGEAHPSQPNYVELISGSTHGVHSDSNVTLNFPHIGDLLEKAGKDWRVYAEAYPGNCFTGNKGTYARKHVPFISFSNVTSDAARCAKIMSADSFFSDYATGKLPEYTLYVPDLNNDGHDTGTDFAGQWLTKTFGKVLADPSQLGDTLFILTYDESALLSPQNHIFTALLGSRITPGTTFDTEVTHASILRLIEDEFDIGNLGVDDATAPVISGIFK